MKRVNLYHPDLAAKLRQMIFPRKTYCFLLLINLYFCKDLPAQQTTNTPAIIEETTKNNAIYFNSVLRPLRQVAGAPEPFYTYFWEFDDGSFSFKEKPKHLYKDTGTYSIRLYATNNYDDGRPPRPGPKKMRHLDTLPRTMIASVDEPSSLFKKQNSLIMRINAMPRPTEELVVLFGYRNPGKTSVDGSLLLFYNEKEFSNKNFTWLESRTYHHEKRFAADSALSYAPSLFAQPIDLSYLNHTGGPGPAFENSVVSQSVMEFGDVIAENKKQYKEDRAWRFEKLGANEERFLFVSLQTTPEMIKDTNAVITISGLFIPDDPSLQAEQYILDLQIVASHDPNRMMLRNRVLNYRFLNKYKKLHYKIAFQNTGKGPATNMDIAVGLDKSLDARSLQIDGYQPYCIPCKLAWQDQSCFDTLTTKDSIHFIFKNIYLPGIRDVNISDPDSTVGFVSYTLNFSGRPPKLPFLSRASITFDKNPAVHTNKMTGDFRKGFSPGAVAGYEFSLNKYTESNYFLGVSLSSAFSPWKKYMQWELFVNYHTGSERMIGTSTANDTLIGNTMTFYQQRIDYQKLSRFSLWITPFQLRYNLKDWVGAGIGVMGVIDIKEKTCARNEYTIVYPSMYQLNKELAPQSRSFVNSDAAIFGDVQAGMVRRWPALGFRYLYRLRAQQHYGRVYATWRF